MQYVCPYLFTGLTHPSRGRMRARRSRRSLELTVARPSVCTFGIRPEAAHISSRLYSLDARPLYRHAKVGSARVHAHTRTVRGTRIQTLRHGTSDPIPRPHGASDGGTGGSRRWPRTSALVHDTFSSGVGLPRRCTAASPVHVQQIAKSGLRPAAKREIVGLSAHNKGTHDRVAQ